MTANHTQYRPNSCSPNGTQPPVVPAVELLLEPTPPLDIPPTDSPVEVPVNPTYYSPEETPTQPPRVLPLGLSLSISAAIALASLAVGVGSYLALQARVQQERDQQQQLLLEQAQAHHEMNDFQRCLDQISTIVDSSPVFVEAQRLQRSCQQGLIDQGMEHARQLADQGQYRLAIAGLSQLAINYQDGQIRTLMTHLSQRMVAMAWEYYHAPTNHLNDALTVLRAIPSNSPLYSEAQEILRQMQAEWSANEQHVQAAVEALQTQDLVTARRELDQVTRSKFWQLESQPLWQTLESLELEQRYIGIMEEAEEALSRQEPRNAIAIIQQLPDVSPWLERKEKIRARAIADIRQQGLCQTWLSWAIDCY